MVNARVRRITKSPAAANDSASAGTSVACNVLQSKRACLLQISIMFLPSFLQNLHCNQRLVYQREEGHSSRSSIAARDSFAVSLLSFGLVNGTSFADWQQTILLVIHLRNSELEKRYVLVSTLKRYEIGELDDDDPVVKKKKKKKMMMMMMMMKETCEE
jgi:hypothetical protein